MVFNRLAGPKALELDPNRCRQPTLFYYTTRVWKSQLCMVMSCAIFGPRYSPHTHTNNVNLLPQSINARVRHHLKLVDFSVSRPLQLHYCLGITLNHIKGDYVRSSSSSLAPSSSELFCFKHRQLKYHFLKIVKKSYPCRSFEI